MSRAPISVPRRRKSKGTAIIETGLSFLTFGFLLIGSFDFGQFLFVQQALTERARYAARWGVANDPATTCGTGSGNPLSCDAIKNMVLYNSSSPGSQTYFNLVPTCTTSSSTSLPTGGTCAQYWDAGTDNARVVVSIMGYQYVVLSPYIGGKWTGPSIVVTVPVGRFD